MHAQAAGLKTLAVLLKLDPPLFKAVPGQLMQAQELVDRVVGVNHQAVKALVEEAKAALKE